MSLASEARDIPACKRRLPPKKRREWGEGVIVRKRARRGRHERHVGENQARQRHRRSRGGGQTDQRRVEACRCSRAGHGHVRRTLLRTRRQGRRVCGTLPLLWARADPHKQQDPAGASVPLPDGALWAWTAVYVPSLLRARLQRLRQARALRPSDALLCRVQPATCGRSARGDVCVRQRRVPVPASRLHTEWAH